MCPVYYIGSRVKNALRFAARRCCGFNSDFGQDRWVISDLFHGMSGGFFVDVGAYDGFIASNTYVLEHRFGWKGICIEPNRKSFQRLRNCRRCICVETCVASAEGTVAFLESAGLWGGIVNAYPPGRNEVLSRFVLKRNLFDADGGFKTVMKKTVPLVHVLREYNAPRVIDYLSLDTEGSEYDILKHFPFYEYTFLALTVEHNSISPARNNIRELLLRNGYTLAKEGSVDDYYVHPLLEERYRSSQIVKEDEMLPV